jgi:hypothetical protein
MTRNLTINTERLLPWENAADYETLYADLMEEHEPQGSIERHLVEELAGIVWRKKRVVLAESALHRKGLNTAISRGAYSSKSADRAVAHLTSVVLTAGEEETAADLKGTQEDELVTLTALKTLRAGKDQVYEATLAELREDTRRWWEDKTNPEEYYEGEEIPYERNAEGLQQFIEREVCPRLMKIRTEIENRPLLRSQALGESLDPGKMGELAKHEGFLDRKLENTLALLMKLQKTRRSLAA